MGETGAVQGEYGDMSSPEPFPVAGSVAERDGMEAALAAAGIGTWRWDVADGVVRWDATLEALCGLRPDEFGATYEAWLLTLHPDDRDDVLAIVQEALERRCAYRLEHRTIWPDGTVRWVECRGEVLTDLEGNAAGTVGCAMDITARKLAELEQVAGLDEARSATERLVRLHRLSQTLSTSLTVDEVGDAVVDGLADPTGAVTQALWLIDPLTDDLVLAAQRGMLPTVAEAFARIDRGADLPGAVAVRERRTVLSPSHADGVERFPALRDTPRSSRGFIVVPLVAEGAVLGALAFGYDGPLDDGEISYLEAAAGNIAQTLKRVRLAEALEDHVLQIAFLADITRAGVTAADHRDLMRRVAATAVPRLGDTCSVHFIPEPGMPPVVAVAEGAGRRRGGRIGAHVPPVDDGGVDRTLQTGRANHGPLITPSATDEIADAPLADAPLAPDGRIEPAYAITVPIRFQEETIGAMQVIASAGPPADTPRVLDMAQAAADIMGEALRNRWMTDQHRRISTSLQRAFLPPTLPAIAGIDLATAYWPAGAASYVGGDFYDVFSIGEHEWAVLIGDACGTGPDAAATAAIARHTARAAARHGLDHVTVLEWVNQAVKHSDRGLFCTATYATLCIDPVDRTTTIAVAAGGHPLPVLHRADQTFALGTYGTLLGIYDDPRFTVETAELGAGDAIVFYTDGLTDLPPPHNRTTEDLVAHLAGHTYAAASEIVDRLGSDLDDRLAIHRRADDTAILVIRSTGLPA